MFYLYTGSEWPTTVENRLALSIVAASILGGEGDNVNKWDCVGDVYPHMEGAPKSLREMEWYMLDYVGSVNVSADTSEKTPTGAYRSACKKYAAEYKAAGKKCEDESLYYDKKTQGVQFYTGGADFGKSAGKSRKIQKKIKKV